MAVSAYQSVLSLKQLIPMVRDLKDGERISEEPESFESLEPTVDALQEFLERVDSARIEMPPEMKDLVFQIPPVATTIQFIVDKKIVKQLVARYLAYEKESAAYFSGPLVWLIQKIEKCVNNKGMLDDLKYLTTIPSPEDDLESIVCEITRPRPTPTLEFIPIDTYDWSATRRIAARLKNDQRITKSFDLILFWECVLGEGDILRYLKTALRVKDNDKESEDEKERENEEETEKKLKVHVIKELSKRKFCIFIQPFDGCESFTEKLKHYFLDNQNESRVVVFSESPMLKYPLSIAEKTFEDDLESTIFKITKPDATLEFILVEIHDRKSIGLRVVGRLEKDPHMKERFELMVFCELVRGERNILQSLGAALGIDNEEKNKGELEANVVKELTKRTYCIVIWPFFYGVHEYRFLLKELKSYLPDDQNGSRVIVITQSSMHNSPLSIATHVGRDTSVITKNLRFAVVEVKDLSERYNDNLRYAAFKDNAKWGSLEDCIHEITCQDQCLKMLKIQMKNMQDDSRVDSLRQETHINERFELVRWVEVIHEKDILLALGDALGVKSEEDDVEELKARVVKELTNHKYCIFVVIRFESEDYGAEDDHYRYPEIYLPDDRNGSRFVLFFKYGWCHTVPSTDDLELLVQKVTLSYPPFSIIRFGVRCCQDCHRLIEFLEHESSINKYFDLVHCGIRRFDDENIMETFGTILGVRNLEDTTEELETKVLEKLSYTKYCIFMLHYQQLGVDIPIPDRLQNQNGSRIISINMYYDTNDYRADLPFRRSILNKSQAEYLYSKFGDLKQLLDDKDNPYSKGRDVEKFIDEICGTVEKSQALMGMGADYQLEMEKDGAMGEEMEMSIKKLESIKTRLLRFDITGAKADSTRYGTLKFDNETSTKPIMLVSFENRMKEVMDELTNDKKSLQVIPIVGIGGIGKTTLARCVFDEIAKNKRFDKQYWCTISQNYNMVQIIQSLLLEYENEEERDLGTRLYMKLSRNRYLIVMDDMWELRAYEHLLCYLPNQDNGSKIIVTTRIQDVADSLKSRKSCVMGFLDAQESWDFLKNHIFQEGDCPSELKEIGKSIAKSCGGLPISLITIGGLLKKSSGIQDWKKIEQNVKKLDRGENDDYEGNINRHSREILSLSYDELPIHLKTCYLYFAFFKQDEEIQVKKLLRYWVSNGLVKSEANKSMLESGEEHLEDLINKNLVVLRKRNSFGRIKHCGIHNRLLELCKRKVVSERFLANDVPRTQDLDLKNDISWNYDCNLCGRNLSLVERDDLSNENRHVIPYGWISLMRMRICKRCVTKHPYLCKSIFVNFMCKALDSITVGWKEKFLTWSYSTTGGVICSSCSKSKGIEISETCKDLMCFLYHLKMISMECKSFLGHLTPTTVQYFYSGFSSSTILVFGLPSPILCLWKLQFLVIEGDDFKVDFPEEIWEMQQLMYLDICGFCLPEPKQIDGKGRRYFVLKELQKLFVGWLPLRNVIIERIPNLVKLKVCFSLGNVHPDVVSACLDQLQSLTLRNCGVIKVFTFPFSLKKLSISNWKCEWNEMKNIGCLPNLQLLKLACCGVDDSESYWVISDGEFTRLKVLKVYHPVGLMGWTVEDFGSLFFLRLERLILNNIEANLDVLCLEESQYLLSIHLSNCSEELVNSVLDLQRALQENGNEDVEIYVGGNWSAKKIMTQKTNC